MVLTGYLAGGREDVAPRDAADTAAVPAANPPAVSSPDASVPLATTPPAAPPAVASVSPSVTPSVTPSAPPPAPVFTTYRCWDGAAGRSLKACGVPTGITGLEHVFPNFNRNACEDQKLVYGGIKREQMWVCSTRSPQGNPVQVRYSEYARARHRPEFGRLAAKWAPYQEETHTFGSRSDRYVWHYSNLPSYENDLPQVISWIYAEHPYSVSIEAYTRQDADWALQKVVAWRNPAEMRGVKS